MASLEGETTVRWEPLVRNLQKAHIRIKDEGDSFVCTKNLISINYTTCLGYKVMTMEETQGGVPLWWKVVWKINSLMKSRIFLHFSFSNKASTWDVLQKRSKGPATIYYVEMRRNQSIIC
jgi:hypothetical protein